MARNPARLVLAPAIALARDGFILSRADAAIFAASAAAIASDPGGAAIFLDAGKGLPPGARLIQPDLAATLGAIAADGAERVL